MSYETRYAALKRQERMNRPYVPPDPNRLTKCPCCDTEYPLPEYLAHADACVEQYVAKPKAVGA